MTSERAFIAQSGKNDHYLSRLYVCILLAVILLIAECLPCGKWLRYRLNM